MTRILRLLAPLLTAWPAAGESLHFRAEWRLMKAGNVEMQIASGEARLTLSTAGVVRSLYRVDDEYRSAYDAEYCTSSSFLRVSEGKRERESKVTFQQPPGKASFVEHNLATNEPVETKEIDVPVCVHDVISALEKLRKMRVPPGKTVRLPVSNGRKLIEARVDAQMVEAVVTPAGKFRAVRYEAHLMNGELFRRKGRLFIWLTDDERRMPVRFKVQLPFYFGSVTIDLEKEERG
jgi:hypothetical protein